MHRMLQEHSLEMHLNSFQHLICPKQTEMQFVQHLKSGQGKVTFGNFNKTMTIGDDVNDSSSRGPSTPNFDIKPDVSAPGTNIMSTIPMYKADFPDATYERSFLT